MRGSSMDALGEAVAAVKAAAAAVLSRGPAAAVRSVVARGLEGDSDVAELRRRVAEASARNDALTEQIDAYNGELRVLQDLAEHPELQDLHDEEAVRDRLAALEEAVEEAESRAKRQALLIMRLRQAPLLESCLTEGRESSNPLNQLLHGLPAVLALRNDKMRELARLHTRSAQLNDELFSVRATRADAMPCVRQLYRQLEEAKAERRHAASDEASSPQQRQRLLEQSKALHDETIVLCNTLQGLIFESGFNWARDPHWSEVVLALGQ
eukprot:jgi/Chlat1/4706/Chrsp30S04758